MFLDLGILSYANTKVFIYSLFCFKSPCLQLYYAVLPSSCNSPAPLNLGTGHCLTPNFGSFDSNIDGVNLLIHEHLIRVEGRSLVKGNRSSQ